MTYSSKPYIVEDGAYLLRVAVALRVWFLLFCVVGDRLGCFDGLE